MKKVKLFQRFFVARKITIFVLLITLFFNFNSAFAVSENESKTAEKSIDFSLTLQKREEETEPEEDDDDDDDDPEHEETDDDDDPEHEETDDDDDPEVDPDVPNTDEEDGPGSANTGSNFQSKSPKNAPEIVPYIAIFSMTFGIAFLLTNRKKLFKRKDGAFISYKKRRFSFALPLLSGAILVLPAVLANTLPSFANNESYISIESGQSFAEKTIQRGDLAEFSIPFTFSTDNFTGYTANFVAGSMVLTNENGQQIPSINEMLPKQEFEKYPSAVAAISFDGFIYLPLNTEIPFDKTIEATDSRTKNLYLAVRTTRDTEIGAYRLNGSVVKAATNKDIACYGKEEMQNFDGKLAIGEKKTLCDNRDGKEYVVTKQNDGKIWMTTNLDLDLVSDENGGGALRTKPNGETEVVPLTPENTNIDQNYYPRRSTSTDKTEEWLYEDDLNPEPESFKDVMPDYSFDSGNKEDGNYYNYLSATADVLDFQTLDINPTLSQSICPVGWKMARSDEFHDLIMSYSAEFDTEIVYDEYDAYGKWHGIIVSGTDLAAVIPYLSDTYTGVYVPASEYAEYIEEGSDDKMLLLKQIDGANIEVFQDGIVIQSGTTEMEDEDGIIVDKYMYYIQGINAMDADYAYWGGAVRCVSSAPRDISIIYDENTEDVVQNLPEKYTEETIQDSKTLTISEKVPTRAGYIFGWWETEEKEKYLPGEDIEIKADTRLYAKWLKKVVYDGEELLNMNQMTTSVCESLEPEVQYGLADIRDGNVYSISKFKDDNCWMTTELRLNLNNENLEFTLENTDIDNAEEVRLIGNYGTDNVGSEYVYNWYGATLTDSDSEKDFTTTHNSICPSGWTLPSYSNFDVLRREYGENPKIYTQEPFNYLTHSKIYAKLYGEEYVGMEYLGYSMPLMTSNLTGDDYYEEYEYYFANNYGANNMDLDYFSSIRCIMKENKSPRAILTEDGNLDFSFDRISPKVGQDYVYYAENNEPHQSKINKIMAMGINENPDYPEIEEPQWRYHYEDEIKSINFEISFHDYKPKSLYGWFDSAENLEKVTNAENLNTSEVVTMKSMFRYAGRNVDKEINLDFSSFDMGQVKDISYMFCYFGKNVGTINLSGWNMPQLTSAGGLFEYDYTGQNGKIKKIDIGGWNTPILNTTSYMFQGARIDDFVGLEDLGMTNVTNMREMFAYAETSDVINLSDWNVSKVSDLAEMFRQFNDDSGKNTNINLSGWNLQSATTAYEMFLSIGSPDTDVKIDLSGWHSTSNIKNMSGMFSNTGHYIDGSKFINHLTVKGLAELDVSGVTDMSNMFSGFGGKTNQWTTNDEVEKLDVLNLSGWDVSTVENMRNIFGSFGVGSDDWELNVSGWNIKNAKDLAFSFSRLGTYCAQQFSDDACNEGISAKNFTLKGVSDWRNTGNVTNIAQMFEQFGVFEKNINIDLSGWNTSNITNMGGLFGYTGSRSKKVELNLSNWDLRRITDTYYIPYPEHFRGAGYYANEFVLDIKNWNLPASLTEMSGMFAEICTESPNCSISGIETLNTRNIEDMWRLFKNSGFKELDLSTWQTSNLTTVKNMFANMKNLTTIYVGDGWDVSKIEDNQFCATYECMFNETPKLVGGAGTRYDEYWWRDVSFAHVDGGESNPGYLTYKAVVESQPPQPAPQNQQSEMPTLNSQQTSPVLNNQYSHVTDDIIDENQQKNIDNNKEQHTQPLGAEERAKEGDAQSETNTEDNKKYLAIPIIGTVLVIFIIIVVIARKKRE